MSDLIDRQAAIEALEKFEKQCWEDMCFRPLMSDARVIIKGLPSVEPRQRTGRWKIVGEEVGALGIRYQIKQCSECGWKHSLLIPEDFCPNCGARMRDGE